MSQHARKIEALVREGLDPYDVEHEALIAHALREAPEALMWHWERVFEDKVLIQVQAAARAERARREREARDRLFYRVMWWGGGMGIVGTILGTVLGAWISS
jgi:hypothetical protein